MITHENQNYLLEAVRDFAINHLNVTDITAAEDEIQKILQIIGNTMMQEAVAKMSGSPTYRGVRISCDCGKKADFKGYRKRWIKTLHGDVTVERGYYRCSECHNTYNPWDTEQGLNSRVCSPRVKAFVATVCADLPYKAAMKLVKLATGLVIEESSGEEIVRDIGIRLRIEEEKQSSRR